MKVAVFFGSKSDTEVMKKACAVLADFGVAYDCKVISAHRAGELLREAVRAAEADGCEVFIAGAGLAAHLPGVIASMTVRPVIGVPLGNAHSPGGLDSLLSIVQMPPQIPVAAVGIDNAANAAYLALSILSAAHPQLREKLQDFRKKLEAEARKAFEQGADI